MAKRMGYALAYPIQFDINRVRSRLPGAAYEGTAGKSIPGNY